MLPERATEEELAQAISATPGLRTRFELKSGYVTEKGAGAAQVQVATESRNRRSATANLWWAGRFVPQLSSTLFSMVAASGSTSYRSASRSRDLDLFCVAPTGRLWTALTKGLIAARAFRTLHPASPEICFSCMMDEEYAARMFNEERGALFARDALETVVLRGEGTFRRLLKEAGWISALYPSAYSVRLMPGTELPPGSERPSTASTIAEGFLLLVVGGYLRIRAKMLNRRFSKAGMLDSVFKVRIGRDHLIYESRRYSRLRQRYSEGIPMARHAKETE